MVYPITFTKGMLRAEVEKIVGMAGELGIDLVTFRVYTHDYNNTLG